MVNKWQQGELIELEITDLTDEGNGVGHYLERVVFIPDSAIGDRLKVRLIRIKPKYGYGQIHSIITPSDQRTRPHCIVADKCGGCQWQHIKYQDQLTAKQNLVQQTLQRIGDITQPNLNPIISAPESLGYRNKVTYPLGISTTGIIQTGYYQKGTHQVVNINQCPVQDPRLNIFLNDIKQDIQKMGWSIYDESKHEGLIRHIGLRIGRQTNQILLTLIATNLLIPSIEILAQDWLDRYPNLVGVCLNHNPDKTNRIFGNQTLCLAGRNYIEEILDNITFRISSDTFFQIYTEQMELVLELIKNWLNLTKTQIILDGYCGIGTITLPLAKLVKLAIGIESEPTSITQAQINAKLNNITNIEFITGPMEKTLPNLSVIPDIVILDPPRSGCDPIVIQTLLNIHPQQIIYLSCKPSTLARDLKLLTQGGYQVTKIQPIDFFPQTPHVETLVLLDKSDS